MNPAKYDVVQGFNVIAPAYDLANDAMTAGLHRLWRRQLCRKAANATPKAGQLLDLATGTADVAIGVVRQRPDIFVTGVDPSEGMLKVGSQKIQDLAGIVGHHIQLKLGDARNLELPDATFDTVTISWGIRNVNPFQDGLKEILRVLKPKGHLFVLESGTPELAIVRNFYGWYARILPFIGGKISGFKPAYRYYAQTVDTFPRGSEFVAALFEAGFVSAQSKALAGGIVYLYSATKPNHQLPMA